MTGKVIALNSDVIDIQFPKSSLPQMGIILRTESGAVLSTEIILDEQTVRAIVLSQNANISLNENVESTDKPLQVPVGEKILGRIFNVFGEPLDNKPHDPEQVFENVEVVKSSQNTNFILKDKRISTGIKVIDFFIPILEGDKIGMFGGAGVGKTLVIKEIINNLTKRVNGSYSLFVGIGERSREGEELYRELLESNLLDKVSLIFAQMNGTPGARMKVIYSALTMAEYFRDHDKKGTYMFIDNVYRYVQAGSEISSSLGRIPAQSGYQPTLASDISIVQERISNTKNGSITAFETVFVPADDITDPAVVAIFAHLDSSLVLDRKYAAEGKYPAISPLASSSNNLSEEVVGRRHLSAVLEAKKHLQRYDELADLLMVLGQDGISGEDQKIVKRARMIQNFFTQNFFVAENYTQRAGEFVPLEKVIEGVEKIVAGDFDEIDPTDFFYIGDVSVIEEKVEILKALREAALRDTTPTKKRKKTKGNNLTEEQIKDALIRGVIDARREQQKAVEAKEESEEK